MKTLVLAMLVLGCNSQDKGPPHRDPEGPTSPWIARLRKLQADVAAIDAKVATEVVAVANATDPAERRAAAARLVELQTEQAELTKRLEEATALSKKCLENPLEKGCA